MRQTYLPGTEPEPVAEAKKALAAAEKVARDSKKQMQDAALKIAEYAAEQLIHASGAELSQAAAAYLNGRDAYLAATRDAGQAAAEISTLLRRATA